jgi:hypothetical protein
VIHRVSCTSCGSHRDAAVWEGPCLVCGGAQSTPVPPSPADRPSGLGEVIAGLFYIGVVTGVGLAAALLVLGYAAWALL